MGRQSTWITLQITSQYHSTHLRLIAQSRGLPPKARRESTLDHHMDHQQTYHPQTSRSQEPLSWQHRQYRNSMLYLEKLENSGDSEKPTRSPSTKGWGCHHGSYLPLDMWHMFLTSPPVRPPPETPCSTPFIQIRRPEWLVLTRGLEIPGFHPDPPKN